MVLKISTISIAIGILIGGLSLLFMKPNSNLSVDKINEIIQLNEIEEGDTERLNQEIKRIVDAGLIINYLSINFYIGIFMILLSIFGIFLGSYLIVDKLFFKKFYENPDYFDATRRGIFICLTVAFVIYFKLLNVGLELILALPIITIFLEIGFYKYIKPDIVSLSYRLRNKNSSEPTAGKMNERELIEHNVESVSGV